MLAERIIHTGQLLACHERRFQLECRRLLDGDERACARVDAVEAKICELSRELKRLEAAAKVGIVGASEQELKECERAMHENECALADFRCTVPPLIAKNRHQGFWRRLFG